MNTTTTHTPGRWIIDDGRMTPDDMAANLQGDIGTGREWTAVGIADEDGFAEAVAYCHPNNAPLIAAAPELLGALRDACPVLFTLANGTITNVDREMARAAFEQARAAIAKAEGRAP